MRPPERGATPAGFRHQVLARLRNLAQEREVSVQRLQQRVAFERLLARLAARGAWTLKGGFALELRYGWESRPTRDIDLRIDHPIGQALERLRSTLAEADNSDRFTFELGPAVDELQGSPGGSIRVRVTARLAGVVFDEFHADLSAGDPIVGEPEVLAGSDLLEFAGISAVHFPVYPVTQQLAEKLHAYTLPRARENTRTKDFLDLVVVSERETVAANELLNALEATFQARATHEVPGTIPAPPSGWTASYARLTGQLQDAASTTLDAGYEAAARFWDPLLSGGAAGLAWNPRSARWEGPRGPEEGGAGV